MSAASRPVTNCPFKTMVMQIFGNTTCPKTFHLFHGSLPEFTSRPPLSSRDRRWPLLTRGRPMRKLNPPVPVPARRRSAHPWGRARRRHGLRHPLAGPDPGPASPPSPASAA